MKYKWIVIIKYLFSFLLTAAACIYTGSRKMAVCAVLELLIIGILSELIEKKVVRYIVNDILVFLYNAQMIVLLFGSSYISTIMLTNIDNIQDLSGKAVIYSAGVAVVLFMSFLPCIKIWKDGHHFKEFLSLILCLELVFTLLFGNAYSPLFAYWKLADETIEVSRVKKELSNRENVTPNFYRGGISCISVDKPDILSRPPNIVLILTEGLSQHIVSDERGIMPNVAAYEGKSISFRNYYDHTAATYRGIIGQLYSGYQLNNYDTNTLIGIQDILSDNGYVTSFINTEPNLVPFAKYLERMNFDILINDVETKWGGPGNSMTDREAYEKLYEVMEEQYAVNQPFFTVIYTFGTHASFDSPDEQFEDGTLSELNKFYNLDCWFGQFMDKLEKDTCWDNTIIVFTSDHATYADLYYKEAFPDYSRNHVMLDQIPLFIYHKGIEPKEIDVNGRNSLDLTSTILDYVDINAPNYFLGASLFHDDDNNCNLDTIFTTGIQYYSSKGGIIQELQEEEMEYLIVNDMIEKYYAAKTQEPHTA